MFPNEPIESLEIMTFQDALDRLAISRGSAGTGTETNAFRMAIIDAMRELPGKHSWPYYRRAIQITTVAPISDYTVTYTHTGGTIERQLELSSGTWHSTVASGQIYMLDNLFRVSKRVSSTVVQLAIDSNPGVDVDELDVQWVQTAYPLGQSVRRLLGISEARTNLSLNNSAQSDLIEFQRINPTPSTPILYSIHQSGGSIASMEIEFAPPPLDARTYVLGVEVQPRPLRTYADELTVTADGTSVTALSGSFKNYHVGSILRLSRNADKPTGYSGALSEFNPFVEQRVIASFTDATTVVVHAAFDRTWTSVGAVVTDPLDLDPTTLWDYFFAMAMRKYLQYSPLGATQGLAEIYAAEKQAFAQAVSQGSYIHSDLITSSIRLGIPEIDFILAFPNPE